MDPDFEPTYTMYCGDGGDGGGDGGGDASSPGDTGGAGGDDGAGGNDAGGASGGTSGGDAPSPGDTGGAGGNPSDPGSEASGGGSGSTDTGDMGSEAANVSSTSSGAASVGGVSDTGDLGSEAANVAATQSGAASVGAGSGVTDTGDLGTEAANVAATVSGAASVGLDSTSFTNPYSKTGMIAKNISNYMKGNIAETALASALTAITGIPGLSALNAYSSIYGSPISSTVSGVSQDDIGGGDTGTAITSVAPYLIGNTQAQPSQVLQYFSNLQNQPQTEGLLSRYDQAKQNISGILGTNNQLGASNTSNFYYNYLNQRGLL